jgi:type IV fimbrial biogenesis protein FimT
MSHRSPATPVAEPPVKPAGLRQRGLTLIELLTTLALAAILLTLGVPAFNELMARHRVTTAANGLLADLQLARSEALKRGSRVALCTGGAVGTELKCLAGDWHAGYLIFADADGNGVVDDPADALRLVAGSPDAPVRITSGRQQVGFLADGTADLADDIPATWTFCATGSHTHPKAAVLARSGRASVTAGICP